jgi:hypothetical protein
LVGYRLPRRHADAHLQRLRLGSVALMQLALYLRRRADRLKRRGERSHDPVAGVLYLGAAELCQDGAHN